MAYYNQIDPMEQYKGSGFDPLTGRLSGAQMVMELLAGIQAGKERKKKLSNEDEDRRFELMMRQLQKTQAEQGITKNQQAIQDYTPPMSQAEIDFRERRKAKAAGAQREREITLTGEQNRLTRAADEKALKAATTKATADLNKQFLRAKEAVEKDYSAKIADIEKTFSGQVAALRKPNAKGETSGRVNVGGGSFLGEFVKPGYKGIGAPEANPYTRALQGAHASRKRAKAELEARKAQQLEELERAYSQRLGEVGGQLQTPTAPAQTTGGEVYVNPQTGERIRWDGSNWVPIK